MDTFEKLHGFLRKARSGFLACRNPEYIQGVVVTSMRDVRARLNALHQKYSPPEHFELERRMAELRRTVVIFYLSVPRATETSSTPISPSSRTDLHRKALLYLNAERRIQMQFRELIENQVNKLSTDGSSSDDPSCV